MRISTRATGRIIRGHVLDVDQAGFDRALRDYDSQLYTVWNPTKLRGWGCWEVRRRPNTKTAVYKGTHAGVEFYQLQYVELRDIHHVLDAAFLNYDAIRKIKEMDVWGDKTWAASLDQREEAQAALKEKAKAELKYNISQNRSAAIDFYEAVRSGISPAQILTSVSWSPNK